MDMICGRVSYKHCYDELLGHQCTNVTASVDGLQFFTEINQHSLDEDLIIDGYITYTGKSSMEIRVDV